jgi:hypothetical protein
MKKDACIICGKEKPGLEVKDDYMIDAVRWIKLKIFKSKPKNFRLVVCKDDFLKYKKQRDRYERNQMLYVAIGIIFLANAAGVFKWESSGCNILRCIGNTIHVPCCAIGIHTCG